VDDSQPGKEASVGARSPLDETSIKAGKFLLIAHGTADEVQQARQILQNSDAEQVNVHDATAERDRAA
jgi:hypothetical protein